MRRERRAAFTMVEVAVAVGISTLVIGLAYSFLGQVTRTEERVTRRTDRALAMSLLRDRLAWDVTRMDCREAPDPRVGDDGRSLAIDLWDGDPRGAVARRTVEYRFDPAARTLSRAGTPLSIPGLRDVRFSVRAGDLRHVLAEASLDPIPGEPADGHPVRVHAPLPQLPPTNVVWNFRP